MNIVVLAGGLCDERDVSLTTGSLVSNALIELGHKVILLDVYEGLNRKIDKSLFQNSKNYNYIVKDTKPSLNEIKNRNNNRDELIGINVLEICKLADIVFNALHGSIGENGKIQEVFDKLKIKYTGSGYLGSSLAMNKSKSKELLSQNGVKIPKGITVERHDYKDKINQKLAFPVIVKPNESGSSVGVFIVNESEKLENAILDNLKIDSKVIIEEYIKGREFSVGILGNEILPVIEIIPNEGFYDYKNKYQQNLTKEICPADISKQEEKTLKDVAFKVYKLLKLEIYCRVDIIMKDNGEVYCLEANSLPGLTPTSLIPQEAKAVGIDYNNLINKILELSLMK